MEYDSMQDVLYDIIEKTLNKDISSSDSKIVKTFDDLKLAGSFDNDTPEVWRNYETDNPESKTRGVWLKIGGEMLHVVITNE